MFCTKYFVVLLPLFLLAVTVSGQDSLPWLQGAWQGVGYQPPTDSHWAIELEYDSTENLVRIDYPSLSCSGQWKVVESRDGYAEFTEWITEGKENCDNGGQVIVQQINQEYISIAYFLPEYYDGVVAYSVLRKVEVVKPSSQEPPGRVKKT